LNIEKLKAADDVISTSILNLNEISSVDPDLGSFIDYLFIYLFF